MWFLWLIFPVKSFLEVLLGGNYNERRTAVGREIRCLAAEKLGYEFAHFFYAKHLPNGYGNAAGER